MKKMKKAMLITASVVLLGTAGTMTAINETKQSEISEEVGAAKETKFAKTNYKTTAALNLRSTASTKGKVLLTIPKNTTVSSSAKVGGWFKVTYKGKTGYVSGSYLKKVTSTTKPKPAPAPKVETFKTKTFQTTTALNIRSTASTKGKYLTQMPKGTKVTSSSKQNGWYKVTYKGKTGWASGSYMKEVKPASKPAPKPAPKPTPKPAPTSPGWNSKEVVDGILKKAYTKEFEYSYVLKHGSYELGEVFFKNVSSGKGDLYLDGVAYLTSLEIQPEDFGRDVYDAQKEMLKTHNKGILVYAESQVGSKHAETLRKELEAFTRLKVDTSYRSVKKTIGGKQFKFEHHNASIKVIPQ